MSIRWIITIVISIFLPACQHPSLTAQQQHQYQTEAKTIVSQFTGILKPELKQALQSGGPSKAIEVCSQKAPALTRQLSKKTGWSIRRVSLKPRNHLTAIPDAWEKKILQQFDRDQLAGKLPAGMTATRVEHRQFRFMKAQIVEPVCLLCHGTQITPDVAAALKKYYPMDQARGYELGQVRGAFSLMKQLK